MKTLLSLACLLFVTSLAFAQKPGGVRGNVPSRPRMDIPDPNANTLTFISGQVVVDDGSVLTESVAIQTVCRGRKRTETHTDSRGNFSFQLGNRLGGPNNSEFDVDSDASSNLRGRRSESRDLQDCEVQASLAGFTSDVVLLAGRFTGSERADIGRVVLHRLGSVEGFTISASTARAPEPARKALAKGQEQAKKSKWDEAQKSFEKAVSIYPDFAVAWFELGQLQLRRNDAAGARVSFQRSIAGDPKYINPYQGLARIAMHDQNWRELTDTSEKLLALNPVNFPDFWLWNSIGNYCLQNFGAAEKSARRGLQLDGEHRIPRLEYVLGMTLLKKPDYEEAAQHLRAFLSLSTQPADVAEAQKQLSEVARLSAASQSR